MSLFDSNVAAISLLNYLCTEVVVQLGERARARLERIETFLSRADEIEYRTESSMQCAGTRACEQGQRDNAGELGRSLPRVHADEGALAHGVQRDVDIDCVLVRLDLDGAVGWAETAPYSRPELLRRMGRRRLRRAARLAGPGTGRQESARQRRVQALLKSFKGNQFAKSALDIAWWDASAKLDGKPLWQVIGGHVAEGDRGRRHPVQDDSDTLIGEIAARAGRRLRPASS
jgi:hypothetical protein